MLLPLYHFMQSFLHLFFTLTYFPDLILKVVILCIKLFRIPPGLSVNMLKALTGTRKKNAVSYHSKALEFLDILVLAPDSTIRQNPASVLSYM